jgi:hypothetical protein
MKYQIFLIAISYLMIPLVASQASGLSTPSSVSRLVRHDPVTYVSLIEHNVTSYFLICKDTSSAASSLRRLRGAPPALENQLNGSIAETEDDD